MAIRQRWFWFRHGERGVSYERPADGWLYTEWISKQIVLRVSATRWTWPVRIGVGVEPFRLWLHIDYRVRGRFG